MVVQNEKVTYRIFLSVDFSANFMLELVYAPCCVVFM